MWDAEFDVHANECVALYSSVIPNWPLGSVPLIQSNIWTHHIFEVFINSHPQALRYKCWRFSDVSANIVISTFRVGVFAVRVRTHCYRGLSGLLSRLWPAAHTLGQACPVMRRVLHSWRRRAHNEGKHSLVFPPCYRRYGGTCYFHFQGVPGKGTLRTFFTQLCHSCENPWKCPFSHYPVPICDDKPVCSLQGLCPICTLLPID
jgi:hypothetical protein